MSTYHFKAIEGKGSFDTLTPSLERLKNTNEIEQWEVHTFNSVDVLKIVTNKLSPDEVKHLLRESGVDAEFTRAPEAG